MRKLFLVGSIICAIVIGLAGCKTTDSNPKQLKFNLEKGKSYQYELVWDITQEMMSRKSTVSMLGDYTMKVTGDDGKLKTLEATYKRFKMGFNAGGLEAEVDTDKPLEHPTDSSGASNPSYMMSKMFSGIKGQQFSMTVDPEGRVTSVSGFDKLIQSMVDSASSDPQFRMQMELSLKDQLNEQTIKDQFAMAFHIFPNQAIRQGDTWEKKMSMGGKLPGQYISTYTVKEFKDNDVILDVKTLIRPSTTGGQEEITVEGEQTGTLTVDVRNGLVKLADYDQKFTGKTKDFTINVTGKGRIKGREL